MHTITDHNWRAKIAVLLILLVALLFRAWLITSGHVSFDSDEAVVGLMARHINQGHTIPTFYYGQDYMGSLDAILLAGGFQVLGESVQTIRWVQMILYMLSLLVAYTLAWEITHSRRVALIALLLLAIPTSLGALYTTITLGGYNEIVLLGGLILLLGWQVTAGGKDHPWRWLALGLTAGIGWWVNGAIVTPCAVVVVIGLRHFSLRNGRFYVLAAAAFMIGSAPWWAYNLRHDWAALDFLTGGFEPAPGIEPISPLESLLGLLLLGFPALYGLRFPWQAGFTLSPSLWIAVLIYLLLITDLLARGYARMKHLQRPGAARIKRGKIGRSKQRPYENLPGGHPLSNQVGEGVGGEADLTGRASPAPIKAGDYSPARRWVWLVMGVFMAIFALSSFSDATGRYLMPVWIPAAIGIALGLDRLRRAGKIVAGVLLAVLLTSQAGSVLIAAGSESGLSPQLITRLRTSPEADTALLDFLHEQGYAYGYASYWTSFRLIFRSHEAVIFDTALPYDDKGYQAGNNRYLPYRDQVAGADRVVWVTQNFPALDDLIAQ
ncbi:MAG: glycosyltransferase family 39 protein, partial [Chloroflexi bacterium]|nr:glycosyltransferase family 39 protein [Chloroflexota bacterium]